MRVSTDRWGGKVYQIGRVTATLIPYKTYQYQCSLLGINQALDVQPDGHLGYIANITMSHDGGTTSTLTVIDANDQMIEHYLLDRRGAELALITMRAEYGYNQSGYVSALLRAQYQPCPEEKFKINRLIELQTNPKIAADLRAWADKWIEA